MIQIKMIETKRQRQKINKKRARGKRKRKNRLPSIYSRITNSTLGWLN